MKYSKIVNPKILRQFFFLYGAMIIGIVLGIGISIVNTRFLSVEDYGKLKFIQQYFYFVAILFSFGLSNSGARILAKSKDNIHRDVIGATIVIYSLISFLSICATLLFSLFIDKLFNNDLAYYIRLMSPLVCVYIYSAMIDNILQGTNNIQDLAFFRTLPKCLYISFSLIFNYFISFFNILTAISLDLFLSGSVLLWMFFRLRPNFSCIKQSLLTISKENKVNGAHVYIGVIASVATGQLISICLGYFSNMQSVGYYSLAIVVATPLQFIPSVMGTTLFKSFSKEPFIPVQAILLTIFLTIACLILFWIIIDNVLILVYSKKYLPVVPFVKILSISMAVHGFGDFFNRFLGAHGEGKKLRNAALYTGGTIIIGCIFFLPNYGTVGGTFVRAISSLVYLIVIYLYYRQFIKDTSYKKAYLI